MRTNASVGKARRLDRLFTAGNGKCVIVPLDDSLISGPVRGLDRLLPKIRDIVSQRPDAIMAFSGLIRNYADALGRTPAIINVTASSTRSQHTRKTLVGSVASALRLDAVAVAAHVNIGSKYETEMLHNLGCVSDECDLAGMPLIAIMYPRSETNSGDDNYDEMRRTDNRQYSQLVSHAARIGVELGADLVKTQYTGDRESFRTVVETCDPIPVIVAGGPMQEMSQMLDIASDVVAAGGAGVSFGRNIFEREDSGAALCELKRVVHGRIAPGDVSQDCPSAETAPSSRT